MGNQKIGNNNMLVVRNISIESGVQGHAVLHFFMEDREGVAHHTALATRLNYIDGVAKSFHRLAPVQLPVEVPTVIEPQEPQDAEESITNIVSAIMHYPLFFSPEEVCEIRAIGLSGENSGWEGFANSVVSGYYDNAADFSAGAGILEKAKAPGVYHTLNPANPALIARAANRLKVPKATTQDNDIVCVRWLPIDLDPKRPADISSTDAELAAAVDMAREIAAWMEGELGFSRSIRAKSGNGCHLLYRLDDLPNDEATHALIVAAIAAIRAKFDNAQVDIDVSVVNPARIWKCYGTTGRKGDATPDRPHRKSALFPDQPLNLADVPVTDIAILRELASLAPGANGAPPSSTVVPATPANPSKANAVRFPESTLGPLDVGKYLTHYGVAYTEKEKGARTLYCLDHCVFNTDHTDATIIASPTGPLIYQCFHASCKEKNWEDARMAISGNDSLAPLF